MDVFNQPIVLLALAMFLAIGIERFLELTRAVFDHLEARKGEVGAKKWDDRAKNLRNRIEARLDNVRGGGAAALRLVLSVVSSHLSPAPADSGGLFAVSVDQYRSASIRLHYKLYAILLGVLVAFLYDLNIFALVDLELQREAGRAILLPAWLGKIVSGAAMGLGSGPVHKLITALEDARRKRK